MTTTAAAAKAAAADAVLAREVWTLLLTVLLRQNRHRYRQVADRTGLSIPQSFALQELDPEGRPASMRSLAACLHTDPSNITGLVDRLEAKGLVERRPDPDDRRIKAIVLTPSGRRARAALRRIVDEPPPALAHARPEQLRAMRDILTDLGATE